MCPANIVNIFERARGHTFALPYSIRTLRLVLKIAGSARSRFSSADAYGTYLLESEELIFDESQKSKNPVTVPLKRRFRCLVVP